MNTRVVVVLGLLAGVMAWPTPGSAHHSFNMFDVSPKAEIILEGVVKEWNLTNPHSWLTITVTNPDGTKTDWSFEAAAIPQLLPKGITVSTYKAGDKVRVAVGPIKDGRKAGILKFVQHADGSFTLPNDAGNIGQEALDRWRAGHPESAPARSR
jgi:hypothetical protein